MIRPIALSVVLTMTALSSAAFAQDEGRSHNRGACRADAERLCAGVQHGGGRILECLAGQKDKLSADCRQMVESRGK
jgi:hypothetical protein